MTDQAPNPFGPKPAEETSALQGEVVQPATTQVVTTAPATQQAAPPPTTTPAVSDGGGDIEDVSFDDDVKIASAERFPSMKKGETARIAFMVFNKQDAPAMKMAQYYYHADTKSSFLVPNDPEVRKKVVAVLGEPKVKFGTIIAKYETDAQGNVFPDRKPSLFIYRFSTDKWPLFKALHKEWGLANCDISLVCTEAEFQKITPQATRERLLTQHQQTMEFNADLQEEAQRLYEGTLMKFMPRRIPNQEILVKIGLLLPPGAGQTNTVNPFGAGGANQGSQAALAPSVGTGAGGQQDFSDMLVNQQKTG